MNAENGNNFIHIHLLCFCMRLFNVVLLMFMLLMMMMMMAPVWAVLRQMKF
jgi:hypothetical protein